MKFFFMRIQSIISCWGVVLLALLGACAGEGIGENSDADQPGAFGIEASFPMCQPDSLFIYTIEGFRPMKLAGGAIDKAGEQAEIDFGGNLPAPGFYLVGQAPNNLITVLLGTGETVSLSGNCNNLRQHGKVNSPLNDAFNRLNQRFSQLSQARATQNQRFLQALQTGNQAVAGQALQAVNQVYAQQQALVDSLQTAQPVLGKAFVANLMPVFDPNHNPEGYSNQVAHLGGEYMSQVDFSDPAYTYIPFATENLRGYVQALFNGQLPAGQAQMYLDSLLARMSAGEKLHQNALATVIQTLDQVRNPAFIDYAQAYQERYQPDAEISQYLASRMQVFEEAREAEKLLGVGAVPPEISLPTPTGKTFKLSDLRGKVVLLDFWASWCKPCRMENPNVVRVYQKYKDQGFDILSVSLDRTEQAWKQAIVQDNMDWHHVSDLKFWQSEAAKDYRVTSIPATFLLDREGRIIAKNLRGPALEAKLAEVLGG
jgi:thiol-disulfide isomerase/thioredoxin